MGGQALVFRAGPHLAAIGLPAVSEVLRPLPVEPLVGVPAFVRGICVLRGRPVPVVGVGTLLDGGPPITANRSARFIGVHAGSTSTGEQVVALAVDAVLGIHDVPLDLLYDLSSVAGPGLCEAVGVVGPEPLLFLDATRVVPESVWAALEEAEQAA